MRTLFLLFLICLVHEGTQQIESENEGKEHSESENDASPFSNNCGDCSDIKAQKYTNIGHRCHHMDKTALVKNYGQKESAYPECVPNIFEVIHPIKYYCCFWSPAMGCTILVGEKHYNIHELRCSPCRSYCEETRNGVGRTNYGNWPTIPFGLSFLAGLL